MKKAILTSVVVSITLLGATACSSSKSATPAANSAGTLPSGSADTTGGTGGTGGAGSSAPVVTATGTDAEVRTRLAAEVVASGTQANYTFDPVCVKGIVDQLSASDIQAFRENFNSPALSAEGQALGNKIIACDKSKTSTS